MYRKIYQDILFPFYETFLKRRKTLVYLKELEKNQWYSQEKLKEIQWKKLQRLLRHAYDNVPYYRERFREQRISPKDIKKPEDIRKLPFLTKKDIRNNQEKLIAQNYRNKKVYSSWTGGSTGEPLKFKYDRNSYEWRVTVAARSDRWCGWNFGVKEFYIWGVSSTNDSNLIKFKKKLHHKLLRRKIINSYSLSKKTLPVYIKMFNDFKPSIVIAYTSSLYNFAKYIRDKKIKCFNPKSIIATAEQLYPYQKKLIEDVFSAPIFNRYGCREVMCIAMECERHYGLHMNIDNLFIEFLKDNHPINSGEIGEVTITDLNNYAMPFIRYKIGDLAVPSAHQCPCGRGLPLIKYVAGRVFDTLVTSNGKLISGLFFTDLMNRVNGIDKFQIIQKNEDNLIIKIIKNTVYSEKDTYIIEKEIKKLMGDNVNLNFHFVNEIPLEKSGKQRITVSEVPIDFGNDSG